MLEQKLSLTVVWGELEMAGSMTRALGTNIYLLMEKLNLIFQNHLEIKMFKTKIQPLSLKT